MFTQFFGLKFNPFSKEIPVEDLFLGRDLMELDSRLKYLQNTRGAFWWVSRGRVNLRP